MSDGLLKMKLARMAGAEDEGSIAHHLHSTANTGKAFYDKFVSIERH
jgi:hypothetical protein